MGKSTANAAMSKKSAAPAPKIRLSKEQKIRVSQIIRLENRISVCQEYIGHWSRLFELFAEDIHERQIAEQEERDFFKSVTTLARKHFLFCELMSDTFESGDKIIDVLLQCVSLQSIKGMNDSTIGKLELDWHNLFLEMNIALGRLLRRLPAGMKIDDALEMADQMAKGQASGSVAALPKAAAPKGFMGRLLGRFKKA